MCHQHILANPISKYMLVTRRSRNGLQWPKNHRQSQQRFQAPHKIFITYTQKKTGIKQTVELSVQICYQKNIDSCIRTA